MRLHFDGRLDMILQNPAHRLEYSLIMSEVAEAKHNIDMKFTRIQILTRCRGGQ
jgi:hypothetical protein